MRGLGLSLLELLALVMGVWMLATVGAVVVGAIAEGIGAVTGRFGRSQIQGPLEWLRGIVFVWILGQMVLMAWLEGRAKKGRKVSPESHEQ